MDNLRHYTGTGTKKIVISVWYHLFLGSELAFFGGGSKYYEKMLNTSKIAFTVMYCCAADGTMLPSMVVFKSPSGQLYETWCENGPPGTTYAATPSGWMDMTTFNQWFSVVFINYIKNFPKEDVKVIIGDNLASHLSPFVIRLCEAWNVRFVFLPENSTHLMQPLDVAVFASMKKKWRTELGDWKEECEAQGKVYSTIPKNEFPGLLQRLMRHDFSQAIISGFECCGFCPVDVNRVLARLPSENPEATTDVQRHLLDQLQKMRYGNTPTVRAGRPKKTSKLPAGASYTCTPGERTITPACDGDQADGDQAEASGSGVTTTKKSTTVRPG